jgi:hypothetical protein
MCRCNLQLQTHRRMKSCILKDIITIYNSEVMTIVASLVRKLYVHKALVTCYHYLDARRHSVQDRWGREDYGPRERRVPLFPIFRAKRSSQDEASSSANRYIESR